VTGAVVLGPGQRRAVRVGGVGGGEDDDVARLVLARRLLTAHRPEAVHGPHGGELSGSQSLDEVAAPHPAGFLGPGEDTVDRGEAARDVLGLDRAAGHHAVAVQQQFGTGQRPHGGVLLHRGQEGPPAGRRGRSHGGGHRGARAGRRAQARPAVP